jgi:hypothetical protein
MKNQLIAFIASAAVAGSITIANAMPAGPAAQELRHKSANENILQTQYNWGGNRYCWYDYGWNGPGFYWCGYAARRGYGWGGPRGWHHWDRPGHRDRGDHRVYRGGDRDRGDYNRGRGGDHRSGDRGQDRGGYEHRH